MYFTQKTLYRYFLFDNLVFDQSINLACQIKRTKEWESESNKFFLMEIVTSKKNNIINYKHIIYFFLLINSKITNKNLEAPKKIQ